MKGACVAVKLIAIIGAPLSTVIQYKNETQN